MDMNYSGGCGREGVGRMEWTEGGEWDNCNGIINKYIKKHINKQAKTQQMLASEHQKPSVCDMTKW